jgi:hypothetical protein
MAQRTRPNAPLHPSPKNGTEEAGLCASCQHISLKPTSRGRRFWRCRLADQAPGFARYPALPVIHCKGYEQAADPSDSPETGS